MAYLSAIISGAASLGVLLGLISGIFFLALSALRWASRARASLYDEELRRQKTYLIDNPYVAANRSTNVVEFSNDGNSSYSGSPQQAEGRKASDEKMQNEEMRNREEEEKGEKSIKTMPPDTVQVRELIEKLVETLIGGSLDGITVGKLSSHSACDTSLKRDESNSMHSSLNRLIKRIITEAMSLPNIKEILRRPMISKASGNVDVEDKSYEDILATAILNKVIENFQKQSDVHSKAFEEIETKSNKVERLKRMSRDDDVNSNSDWSEASPSEQLSLTIEEHIEEVTTAFEISDDEKSDHSDFDYRETFNRRVPFPESGRVVRDVIEDENSETEELSSATELITLTSSWEENWLFQKKRLRSTPNAHHPVPVPMLVPNPSEEFRALVGGIDADDLSDMSDCSDSVLEDLIAKDTRFVVSDSTHEEAEVHGHENTDRMKECFSDLDATATAAINSSDCHGISRSNSNSSSSGRSGNKINSVEEVNGHEIDAESQKTNECLSRVMNNVASSDEPPGVLEERKDNKSEERSENSTKETSPPKYLEEAITKFSVNGNDEVIRCRIAEREKEKWNHPVLMVDNPYSLENIEKREQRKRNEYFRTGTYLTSSIDFPDYVSGDELAMDANENVRLKRDYYVNDFKYSSGVPFPPSVNRSPQGNEQNSTLDEIKVVAEPEAKDWLMRKMQEESLLNGLSGTEKPKKREFTLPSVRELAKQFDAEDDPKYCEVEIGHEGKSESKHNTHEKESELDYSQIPVSEIITQLTKSPVPSPKPQRACFRSKCTCSSRNFINKNTLFPVTKTTEKIARKLEGTDASRFYGKEVHSLTARSISKEFREGLKNNSQLRLPTKVADSDQGNIVNHKRKLSPTPPIDLKNMKKFWEEMITANAITRK